MKIRIFFISMLFCFQSLTGLNVSQFDRDITTHLQGNNQRFLRDILLESIALGSPFFESATALEWYFSGYRQEATALAATLAITQIPVVVTKYSVRRPRPQRSYQPHFWNTRITPSFPSGHVASTAAWGSFLSHVYPQSQFLFISLIGLSAYSQVYVGNHFVTDALAGAFLGWMVGQWTYSVWIQSNISRSGVPPPLIKITIPL
jgi:membrane-associated phospholipid phosphatase